MSDRPLHVVIVAYHAPDDLEACLRDAGRTYPITVVDNSQSAAVMAVARRAGANYVDSGGNIGFARAVNLAARRILSEGPSDILLLNPDARIDERGISELVRFLHRSGHERLAAAAPTLRSGRGELQRVAWPFPTPLRGVLEAAGLARLQRRDEFVIGAVLLLRWEALENVGLFDDRFFLYAEETDWQRRAHKLGWHSLVHSDVVATHTGGGTSDDAARRDVLFHAAHETYMRKWYGASGWLLYRLSVLLGSVVRAALLGAPRRRQALRRAEIYLRGPRRVAGFG